jgi:hypothetical protein
VDDTVRALDGWPDNGGTKQFLVVLIFVLWLLTSLAIFFAPEPEA